MQKLTRYIHNFHLSSFTCLLPDTEAYPENLHMFWVVLLKSAFYLTSCEFRSTFWDEFGFFSGFPLISYPDAKRSKGQQSNSPKLTQIKTTENGTSATNRWHPTLAIKYKPLLVYAYFDDCYKHVYNPFYLLPSCLYHDPLSRLLLLLNKGDWSFGLYIHRNLGPPRRVLGGGPGGGGWGGKGGWGGPLGTCSQVIYPSFTAPT